MHHLKWETHADTLMEIQRNLHNDESSCDVLLTSDKGFFFRAHRFLLCFCSDYFKEMFRDVPAGQEVTVIIPEVRPSMLKTILDFIYTGEASVSSTDMTDFFNTVNLLEIKSGIDCERRTVPKQEAVQQYQEGLTIKPVEDIKMEIQQPNDTEEKADETDGMQSEKELVYLEVYSSHEKLAQYTIEQSTERRTVPNQEAVQQYQEGLTIKPVEDIKMEIQQPNDTEEKADETDGMQSEKELVYLEVHSSDEKLAQYTIEQSNERRTVPNQEAVQQYQEGLTIKPVEDIKIEIQQPNDTEEKADETDGMQSEKELLYVEVYSSHEKLAQYTIEQSNNDYILTETTEPSFVLPVERAENEITINPDEVQDVETMELEKKFKVDKPQKVYEGDLQRSLSRKAAFEAAIQEVLRLGVSLQKAAEKYNISKSHLWRLLQKNSAYKAKRGNQMLSSAMKMLEKGESLKTISQMIKMPISTLYLHKVRLLQERRLPQHIQVKRRDANDHLRLAEAISACGRGMAQNQAANLFSGSKSTLCRHLQKQ